MTIPDQISLVAWLRNTILAVGLVFYVLRYKIDLTAYFSSLSDVYDLRKVQRLFSERAFTLIHSALYLILFFAIGRDGKRMNSFGQRLFSARRMPVHWHFLPGRRVLGLVVSANITLFLGMLWFVDNTVVFLGLLALLYLLGIVWTLQMRKTIRSYFDNPNYDPPIEDHQASFIKRRRTVVEQFVFEKRHLTREVFVTTCAVCVFVLAILATSWESAALMWIAYVVLIGGMFYNEYTIGKWRKARNDAIDKIDEEQVDADAIQVGEVNQRAESRAGT